MFPHVALRGIVCPFLRTVRNRLSFQGQLAPDLLAAPSPNNNKRYISRQSTVRDVLSSNLGPTSDLLCL